MTDFSVSALARKWCPVHGAPSRSVARRLAVQRGCCCKELAAAIDEALEEAEKVIPTSWLDSLMRTLPGTGPWGCPDIERLLKKLAAALRALRGKG